MRQGDEGTKEIKEEKEFKEYLCYIANEPFLPVLFIANLLALTFNVLAFKCLQSPAGRNFLGI
jgi:hypothetical protein